MRRGLRGAEAGVRDSNPGLLATSVEAPTATIPRGSLFALFVSGPISVRVPSDLLGNPVVVPRELIPNVWRL